MESVSLLKVLVIDDNPVVASQLTTMLKGLGWSVDFAASGARAVEFGKQQRYDVVLCDARLPDMQSAELCVILKQEQQCCRVAILLADTGSPDIEPSSLAPHFDDVVSDPTNYKDLVTRCQTVLSSVSIPQSA
ncbi:response regulator [Alteromonas sp. ASW11-19]|uniref:Response regulator n=1 Tax=Alteromonas salexigens TaxID=2982530 RepID=A0ABT2VRW2_9ALTE|nr:response regulator [Alteromonas salexigens]MCU7555870.1 response regulator [Alteromonas salexigens]